MRLKHIFLLAACVIGTACGESSAESPDADSDEFADICTLAYYPEGLTVRYGADRINGFPDGVYRVDVIADGEELSITGTMSDATTTCSDPAANWQCTVSLEMTDGRTLWLSLDHGVITGRIRIWYMDGDEVAGGPATARVELYLMEALIGSDFYLPSYVVHEPNGIGCGIATQAAGELQVATL